MNVESYPSDHVDTSSAPIDPKVSRRRRVVAKFENPSYALRSSNVVLNRLVSLSIFSRGGELTTATHIVNTGKTGVRVTY